MKSKNLKYNCGVSFDRERDHQCHRTEYIEADDNNDIIKIEEDDASDNRLSITNSLSSNGKKAVETEAQMIEYFFYNIDVAPGHLEGFYPAIVIILNSYLIFSCQVFSIEFDNRKFNFM